MDKTILRAGKNYQKSLQQKLQASRQAKADEGWVDLKVPTRWVKNPMKTAKASKRLNSNKLNATCNASVGECPTCELEEALTGLCGGSQAVGAVLVNIPCTDLDNVEGTALNIVFYDEAEGVYVMTKIDPNYGTAVFDSLDSLAAAVNGAQAADDAVIADDVVDGEGTLADPAIVDDVTDIYEF